MPKRKLKSLPLTPSSDETFGARLARLRKEKGLTQVELADKVSVVHTLMSDYERGKIRLNADIICRFAQALGVSADELLGLPSGKHQAPPREELPLKLVRRIKKIDQLSDVQQKALLTTIDWFLRGAGIG